MTLQIVDIHPHIISADPKKYPSNPIRGKQSDWSKERPQTFEMLVEDMDRAGVAKAAIVQASTYYGFDNSYLADSIQKDPRRFTGVCTIDVLATDAVAVLQGWMGRGMTGLRLFTGGATHATDASWLSDPRSFPIWEFAARTHIPICVQTTQEGLSQTRTLLEKFPGTRVILDHLARPTLSDGPPYAAAQGLFDLAGYGNLYLKITPRTFVLSKTGRSTPRAFFDKLVSVFGAERIAFGSNLPANEGPMTQLVNEAKECLGALSEADQARIFSSTAKSLYPVLA